MSSTPTAEGPTRYTPVHPDAMVCESDGAYVRYDDYVKLRALVQELVNLMQDGMDDYGDYPCFLNGLEEAKSQGFTPTNTTEG